MGKKIIIGDIHGCSSEFRSLIYQISPKPEDQIILLGDLIDKGPDPAGVVAFAREIGAKMIQGNHEERALRWLGHETKHLATGKVNPMTVSEDQAAEWRSLSADDVAYLSAAPWNMDLGDNFLAVHGGLVPGVPLEKQKVGTALRLRYLSAEGKFCAIGPECEAPEGAVDWQDKYDGPHSLVVGHAVHSLTDPRVDRFSDGREIWNLDTGCVHGGRLTALILQTREVVQVQAEREYSPRKGASE